MKNNKRHRVSIMLTRLRGNVLMSSVLLLTHHLSDMNLEIRTYHTFLSTVRLSHAALLTLYKPDV